MRAFPEAENNGFRMLGKKAAARIEPLGLSIHTNASADGVTIGFGTDKAKGNGAIRSSAVVLQHAHLWTQTALEDYVGAAVAIAVGDRKGAAVVREIEPADAREVEVAGLGNIC